jgi:hypothetical protein
MDLLIAVILWLILTQFMDGRVAFVLIGVALVGRRWLRHQRATEGQRRTAEEMRQLGISPQEFGSLSREEAIERVTAAQEKHRETLAAQGVDVRALTPEIGRDIAWTDIVRQVFRVVEFDRAGTTIGPNDEVEAANRMMPYGYLLVESPIMNQPVRLPIVHRDDFLLAATVFDEHDMAALVEEEELLVTYAPKRKLPGGLAGTSHALHYVITPLGTLERYYAFDNDAHMANPAPEKLFGPFVYDGEIRVQVNSDPQL